MASGPGYRKDPGHSVVLELAAGRWTARRSDTLLADTRSALCIREDGYPPVIYFPSDDVRMQRFAPHDKTSYCPFKGTASYRAIDDVVVAWCYQSPYDEVAGIAGHLAFFVDQVDVERQAD